MANKQKNELWEWVKALSIAIVIAVLIRSFVFTNYIVEGESMMPTLQDGNRLIVNKINYEISQPNRFDVLIFHATPTEDYVKRVIGLPGDSITYKNDTLYVNGEKLKEPFLDKYKAELTSGNLTPDFTLEEITGEKTVPKGKIFVLGDNRQHSTDSRVFGFVDMDNIVGKVNLRYWPFAEFQLLK